MKKIFVVMLVAATIINICAGAFIFLDIRVMQLPNTHLTLQLIDLNAEEAIIRTTLFTTNPNPYSLFIQNITVQTATEQNHIINHLSLAGGEIPAHQNKTFTATAKLRFDGSIPEELTSSISGTVGFVFLGFIKKTLPLHFTMNAPLSILVDQLNLPNISLQGNFSDITQHGVNFTQTITITNHYSFDITIGDISTDVITDRGDMVGTITIQGIKIPGNSTRKLYATGSLFLSALDATTLTMTLTGTMMISIVGIQKTMNLSVNTEIIVPKLDRLLSDIPTEASLSGQYKATLRGLQDHITFEIFNPHALTLLATDINVFIYRVDGGEQRLLCNGTLPDSIITPQNRTIIQGDMLIPYRQIHPRRGEQLIMDRLAVTIRSKITIQGLNQTIWVGVTGYQDFGTRRFINLFS